MALERCEICDELTGNAGIGEDSIVCEICGKVICDECTIIIFGVGSELIICKSCEVKE